MISSLSNTINTIDRWAKPVTKGMPAIATLVGLVILSESLSKDDKGSMRTTGIIGVSLGALTLYSPRIGRIASSISLFAGAVIAGWHKK